MHLKLKSPVGLSNKRIFSSLGVTLHIESTASNRKKNRARELYTRGDPCRIINVRTYLFKEIRSTTICGGPLVSLQGRAHRHMYHYIYTQAHYSGLRSSPSYYGRSRALAIGARPLNFIAARFAALQKVLHPIFESTSPKGS